MIRFLGSRARVSGFNCGFGGQRLELLFSKVCDSTFGVKGFRVHGVRLYVFGSMTQDSGFRVQGLGVRVKGLGFRVCSLGFSV